MNTTSNKIVNIVIVASIFVLLCFLVNHTGKIENHTEVLTGNIDIFEINCDCCKTPSGSSQDDSRVSNTGADNQAADVDEGNNYGAKVPEDKPSDGPDGKDDGGDSGDDDPVVFTDVIAYDDYAIWDKQDLRIFANPMYDYKSIIAPGSSNSYAFAVRNNNDFSVVVDIMFEEVNPKNINMMYKLQNNGNYIFGFEASYQDIVGHKITNINIPAKSEESYLLDWKWIDSNNDTSIGFDTSAFYKLSIIIGIQNENT